MCGITGILNLAHQQKVNRDVLIAMNTSQTHRGPDESGIHIESNVGLGHRRLSIIDLSSGQQPLYNEDKSVVVVYNGEIYNFHELSNELIAHGHIFKTKCDTEVIVHAWEQWGEQCVNKFRGMFAFAIWDSNKQELFLARDRLGIKPLYYSILPCGQFVFASELKAIMKHPNLSKELDAQAIEEYFAYGYVPDPKSIFKSVKKLLPGHMLLIPRSEKTPKVKKYWDVMFSTDNYISEKEACEQLISRLREAVKIRLISDVPLGAFLSGGVDSSSVVSLMSEISSDPVNTCSISFGEKKFNESEYAEQIAQLCQTDHSSLQVEPNSVELVNKLSQIYDEPFADSSAIPTFKVCELARKNVTVALSGDGGDENLGGYRRYKWHVVEEKTRSIFHESLRRPIFGILGSVYPKMDWAPKVFRAKSTFQSLARNSIDGYFHSVSIVGDTIRKKLYSEEFNRTLQEYNAVEILRSYANSTQFDDPLTQIQYLDLKTYLPGDILTKVDRASMANSLEVRVPILDHHLVEWIAKLPPSFKLRNGEGKYIFKKALESRLPNNILYRKKMGFAVPLAQWFRGPLRDNVVNLTKNEYVNDTNIFNLKEIDKLTNEHLKGFRDHSAIIWSLLMFKSFCRYNFSE